MKSINRLTAFIFLVVLPAFVVAQDDSGPKSVMKVAQATNYTLPSSIALNLMEANPSMIMRPGFAKDFKFDLALKDNKLAYNLAIEAQPVWLLFYKHTDYQKLLKQKYFSRILSSLSVSGGTVTKDSIHSLALGAKINLYAEKNPIYDTVYINTIGNFTANKEMQRKIDSLVFVRDFETDREKIRLLNNQIGNLKEDYAVLEKKHFENMAKYKEEYEKENWNAALIDLGYGILFNYMSESFDSLSFSSQGNAFWLSFNFGLGKKILINGMAKYTDIARNGVTTFGANIRFGGLKTNFFVEGLFRSSAQDNLNKITIAYGGDVKVNKNMNLQFGLRTDYNKDFTLKNLVPVINFNYLLND